MNYFSLVMPYHNAPDMWARHCVEIGAMSFDIRKRIQVLVCDDASDVPIKPPPTISFAMRLLRIEPPHIPWSHRAATNVAASYATAPWLVITDIDHLVPASTWRKLIAEPNLDRERVYSFERVNADGSKYKPHPDSWLIHQSMWHKIGGYDTRYRGHYGQNHVFIERVQHHAGKPIILPLALIRFSREDIHDASMPADYPRKSDRDRDAIMRLRRQFKQQKTFFAPGEVVPHVRVFP